MNQRLFFAFLISLDSPSSSKKNSLFCNFYLIENLFVYLFCLINYVRIYEIEIFLVRNCKDKSVRFEIWPGVLWEDLCCHKIVLIKLAVIMIICYVTSLSWEKHLTKKLLNLPSFFLSVCQDTLPTIKKINNNNWKIRIK